MTRSEIWRLEKYLRNQFRLDTITIVERPKQQDSVEVHINGDFVGVLLSLGAKILGNIEVGEFSRIGAGSVVLKSIPAGCTAVGVPAKLVNCAGAERPSQEMNQIIDEQDNKI